MTLRVKISIVPHGVEEEEYTIHTLNISNMGTTDFREWEYIVELDQYKKYDDNTPRVFHKRDDGALLLVHKAIERVLRGQT